MSTNPRYGSSGSISEDDVSLDEKESLGQEDETFGATPPTAEIRKPKDPRSSAYHKYNIFSRLLFLWVDQLFLIGCRRSLVEEDLYANPSEADAEHLLRKFNKYWSHELERKERGQRARLWMVVMKCIWLRLLLQTFLLGVEVGFQISQSVVLRYLIDYFGIECPTAEDTRNAYLFAAGLVVLSVSVVILHAHAFLIGQKNGMFARILTTMAIYNKVLRLSQVTIGKLSIGHIVNLASNDVQRFDLAFVFLPYLVISPLHVIVVTYLIYSEVSWTAFLTTGFIVFQVPLQLGLAKLFAYFRFKSARMTDKRIRIMNEVIVGIRVIKMYAWEYAFKRVVSKLRKIESVLILKGGIARALTQAFNFGIALSFMMALTFITFAAIGGEVTPRRVFVTLLLIGFLRRSTIAFIVRCFFLVYEARVALVRIQTLLETDEIPVLSIESDFMNDLESSKSKSKLDNKLSSEGGYFRPESPYLPGSAMRRADQPVDLEALQRSAAAASSSEKHHRVKMEKVSASWSYEKDKLVLKDISLEVNKDNRLLAIVGPVGAGKSTLLQLLIKELSPVSGSVVVDGKVSYASQEPWVFSGTLRENVLFGLPYKAEWYQKVLEACSLDKDIKQLIDGDLTLVGERGVTLSGGQKARVNLARAVYHDADIVILDDPLSAVDTVVARHLFEECIQGLLRDRLVILVTHQVQFALQADQLLAVKEGEILIYGSHSELVEQGVDTNRLLGLIDVKETKDEFIYKDDDVEDPTEPDAKKEKLAPTTPLSPTKTPMSRFLDGQGTPRLWKKQISFSEEDEVLRDVIESPFDTGSVYSAPSMLSIHSEVGTSKHEDDVQTFGPPAEEKAHGSVSMRTYYNYFVTGGGYILLAFSVFIFILAEGSIVSTDWWISDWADCSVQSPAPALNNSNNSNSLSQTCTLSEPQRIIIYAGLNVTLILLNFLRGALLYFICVNASRVLHNRLFAAVLRAPILFFDNNPSGRILNRFSKDVGFLDDLLPTAFTDYLFLLTRFLAIIITAAAVNYWVLLPAVVVMVVFVALRWYYLKTARDVKRLEAIARSPLYSHISMTIQGLATIRTFGKQDIAISRLFTYQNQHSQGWYLYLITTRWFGIRIDMLSSFFVAAVAFISVPLSAELSAGLVGLALTYSISLSGMFQYCVRQSAEVENIMISTERIMGYGRLEPEAELETLPPNEKPPPSWPDKGTITMEDVAFQYSSELPLVLKDLCFTIQPAEKVGVVGRTGAGKSSLISVLYRLAEPHGLITVDGVDTKAIGLHDLRKKMSIIPQDPVLFSGTMRYNLDPFDEYTDTELWEALEQVQLKSAVQQLEGQLGGEVSEGGNNFSVGQRQLVCLARALLRKNKILVLDEATANVDINTDEIIQQAIRENFSECTVVTIAHRLNTIMDSDRILVMNKGQVKELDSPYNLLQDPRSLFYKMVQKTGPSASRKLQQMARDAHIQRQTLVAPSNHSILL